MTSDIRLLVGGLKSLIPAINRTIGACGTTDARYSYAVWLRHLRMIANSGVDPVRDVVVEIGPGDSIGTGFSALLSTARRYIALDVVPHASTAVQATLLDSVAELFRTRTAIPDDAEFEKLFPRLRDYRFPSDILDASRLEEKLSTSCLDEVRYALAHMASDDPRTLIRYVCPWSSQSIAPGSADLVFSQAALQEIDNRGTAGALRNTFKAMARWLKPGGVMSHQVDLAMYSAEPWDRHWTYGDLTWSVIRGQRPNYINREPLSTYERLCDEFGFKIELLDIVEKPPATPPDRLAPRFRPLGERDRSARGVHIIAVKR